MEWPKEPHRPCRDNVTTPILRAYGRLIHKLPAQYDGLDISFMEAATELNAEKLFASIERDRTGMLGKLLHFAMLLGMENGRRQHRLEMVGILGRLVKEGEEVGADLSWMKSVWKEETARPWPGKRL